MYLLFSNEILFIVIGIPAVYALPPDRKTTAYRYLFHVLFSEAKSRYKIFAPALILTDFEPSIPKAISLEVEFASNSSIFLMKSCIFSLLVHRKNYSQMMIFIIFARRCLEIFNRII